MQIKASKIKKLNKIIIAAVLFISFITALLPNTVNAKEIQYLFNIDVYVNGSEIGQISALDSGYDNNMFVSLNGLSYALKDTDKSFFPTIDEKSISIDSTHDNYASASTWTSEKISEGSNKTASKHKLTINGVEKKYYSYIIAYNDCYDAFFNPIVLSLLFDIDIQVEGNSIKINTDKTYSLSMEDVEESGFLQDVNALVTGDADTDEIFYAYCADEVFPIASTTKLMTYFVLSDAISRGDVSLDDMVTVSEGAAKLSESPDGVIEMKAGQNVPLIELIYGMLLPSSNECAYLVAEHVAGSQDAFVDLMNKKAEELNLKNARFYNAHGLPVYEDQIVPAKKQNRMSANEMFILASRLVNTYPEITDYTTVKGYHLDTLNADIKNTNPVLYNMDNAIGLKTGTTNRAGACLVTCVRAEKDGISHNVITVLLGAVEESERGLVSEIASRYSCSLISSGSSGAVLENESSDDEEALIPEEPEAIVKKLIEICKKKQQSGQ